MVYKTLKYTEHLDPNIKEEHKPFQRTDRKNWKFNQILLCAYTLMPIRIFIIIVFLINTTVCLKILGLVKRDNYNKEFPKWKRTLGNIIGKVTATVFHMCFGFYYIKTVKKDITQYDSSYKKPENIKDYIKQGPITVSNHVSWIDVMILIASKYTPSFLSKIDVAKYPFYGDCTTSLQSIYLDRDNTENRNQVLDLVKERCKLIKEGKNFLPLQIFPEGTTTNGQYLISFKRGAFDPLEPINIVCLKYEDRNFRNAIDIGQLQTVVLQLCQWKNSCTLYDLGTYYPQGNLKLTGDIDQDWKIYAEKVKSIMVKCLDVTNSEAGFRNMREYQNICKEQNKKLLSEAKESNKKQQAKKDQ